MVLKLGKQILCQDFVEISQAAQARMARGGWALLKKTKHYGMKKAHGERVCELSDKLCETD